MADTDPTSQLTTKDWLITESKIPDNAVPQGGWALRVICTSDLPGMRLDSVLLSFFPCSLLPSIPPKMSPVSLIIESLINQLHKNHHLRTISREHDFTNVFIYLFKICLLHKSLSSNSAPSMGTGFSYFIHHFFSPQYPLHSRCLIKTYWKWWMNISGFI